MIGKYNFYDKEGVSFNKNKQDAAPLIPFPTREDVSIFHKKELCIEIFELLKQYITCGKGQAVPGKMTEEQRKIYFHLQEKILLLDCHDIEQILQNELFMELHETDKSEELESFIFLVNEWLHPDEMYSSKQKQDKIGVFHK